MRIEPYYDGMPDPAGLTVKNTEVEELKWGGKFVFVWAIVGGVIDMRFANAIKKGVMAKLEEGPCTGSYCRDVRVSVYDGKMHDVDSNDMAFQIASTICFKEAFHKAHPQILEPVYDLEVMCDAEVMGKSQVVEFNFDELKNMKFRLKVEVGASSYWSELASIETLDRLLQQEAITFKQYLERIPVGLITQKQSLLEDIKNKDVKQQFIYEQMAKYVESLPPQEKERLQSLPPEQQEQEIMQLMMQPQQPMQGGEM